MIDELISTNIVNIQSPSLTELMIFITNIGDKYTIAFFSVLLLSFLLYKKEYLKMKIFTIAITLGVILSQGLKYIIERARPENMLIEYGGYSFPSGHATLAIIFFGMLIYLFKDEIKNESKRYLFIAVNVLLILDISFSRIYLNVHYFSDVLAGLVLGLISIFTAIKIFRK